MGCGVVGVFVFLRTALKSSSEAFPGVAKQESWVNTGLSQLQGHLCFPDLSKEDLEPEQAEVIIHTRDLRLLRLLGTL